MARDYNAAVAALNTLQSNFSIVDAIRKSGRGMNKNAIPEMIEWCRKIGYEPSDFDSLNAIHIAGTKGKGSTSSFVSSILSQCVKPSGQAQGGIRKVGLYTSPHLRFVRERIQINNQPLSEEAFAKYFYETWDRLEASAKAAGHPDPSSPETKPVYFRFLTLMAFHCYLSEGVDTAVVDDAGETIESIAWHKAGIFKPGVPAFSAPQPESAIQVLRERAAERKTELQVVSAHPALESIKLGLAADFQKTNASLAVAIASAHLRQQGLSSILSPTEADTSLPEELRKGLEQVRLGGRCEIRHDQAHNLTWHIDGGHTLESIEMAGRWFASLIQPSTSDSSSSPTAPRVLIFNQQTRDAASLAKRLHGTLATALDDSRPFTHVIFCTNTTYASTGFRPDLTSINTNAADVEALSVQHGLAKTWAEVDPEAKVDVVRTVEEAVALSRHIAGDSEVEAKKGGEEVKVLVTGSLHLVGGVVEVLESEAESAGKTNA
ncbi:hypothetical protein H2203_003481 [Taxawa tesnikishii (nom. ined.)]|nr:hypothetical protein H2203_003481 [Dothideales sp. JES 119]